MIVAGREYGMTDRQFDTYQQSLLRELKRIRQEVDKIAGGAKIKELEDLIQDTESHLQRP